MAISEKAATRIASLFNSMEVATSFYNSPDYEHSRKLWLDNYANAAASLRAEFGIRMIGPDRPLTTASK